MAPRFGRVGGGDLSKHIVKPGKSVRKIFIFPDTHIAFENKVNLELAIRAAEFFKPDICIFIDDWWDFYTISKYDKSPSRKVTFMEECQAGSDKLREIKKRVQAKRWVFMEGNHERRWYKLICKHPQFFGVTNIRKLLGIGAGWEFYEYGQQCQIGKNFFFDDQGAAGKYAMWAT